MRSRGVSASREISRSWPVIGIKPSAYANARLESPDRLIFLRKSEDRFVWSFIKTVRSLRDAGENYFHLSWYTSPSMGKKSFFFGLQKWYIRICISKAAAVPIMLMRNGIELGKLMNWMIKMKRKKNSRTKCFLSINEGGLEWNIWLNIQKTSMKLKAEITRLVERRWTR